MFEGSESAKFRHVRVSGVFVARVRHGNVEF